MSTTLIVYDCCVQVYLSAVLELFSKQLFLRVKARAELEQPMKRVHGINTASRAAPAWYDHTAVQCACAVDTVTVDKADHSQAWPWPELGGSAPVPLGQRLCIRRERRVNKNSSVSRLVGGWTKDWLSVNSTKTRLLPRWPENEVLINTRGFICRTTYTFYL